MERSYDYHSNNWDKYNGSPGSLREEDRDMDPSYDRQSIHKSGYSSHGDYDDRLRDGAVSDRREDPKKRFDGRRDYDDEDDDYSSPPRKNSRSGSKGRYSPPARRANSPENIRDSSWMDDETSLVVIHDVPDKITETEGYLVIQGEKLPMTYSDRKLQHERDLPDRSYRDHDHRDRHDRGDSRYDRGDRDRRSYHDERTERDDDRRSKWPHDRYERHDNGNDRSRKEKSIDRPEHHNKKTETMIVMGLEKRTTVSAIRTAFEYITHYGIVDIRLVKDKYGQSRGFCFVQWASVEECSQVLEYLKTATPRFHIENRQVQLDYSQPRHPEPQASSVSANAAAAAIEAARWSRIGGTASTSTGAAVNTPDSSSRGKGYEQPSPHRSQLQVPMHPLTPAMPQHTPKFSSSVDPGRPKRYPTPDISTYQYDESSGYYYDRSTSLYYNSSTRYYYNSFTGVYLYWDQKTHNYVPVSSETQAAQVSSARESQKVDGESKPEKSKTAKQVAKDMERWAKAQNKKKDEYKRLMEGKNLSGLTKESATVDAGFSILENAPSEAERRAAVKDAYMKEEFFKKPSLPNAASKRSAGEVMSTLQTTNTSESFAIPGLSSYENGSDSEEEEDSQAPQLSMEEQVEKLTDWKKMTCLLCRRAFTSKDALDRHRSLSDLHKQNVEALRVKSKAISQAKKYSQSADVQTKYRDRAAERRSKYGIADPPPKKSRYLAPVPYEQPTKDGIDDTNIGNKMLQKMGWKSGSGLGKSQSGITVPIMAEQRTMGAGLGMRGSTYGTKAGDSYRDALKQRTAMRYHEID